MKIQSVLSINNYGKHNYTRKKNPSYSNNNNAELSALSSLSLTQFPHISFKNDATKFILRQTKDLKKCAYSDLILLEPSEAHAIYAKLKKAPNTASAINQLKNVADYMHSVESMVFDFFLDAPNKSKSNFKAILTDLRPDCLKRLEEKQEEILTKTDNTIQLLNATLKAQLSEIREHSLNGNLKRKSTLYAVKALIEKLKSRGFQIYNPEELQLIEQIYKTWYKSPSSSKDFDAFVVKYSRREHEEIAKRLISTSEATAEHIIATSEGGSDELGNLLLVSAEHNNNRMSENLIEYDYLNDDIDIAKNLEKYAKRANRLIKDKRSELSAYPDYTKEIAKNIAQETNNKILLNI